MSALFYTAQAFVCAMIFEFGHEAGLYPALLVELRTVACNSLQVGRCGGGRCQDAHGCAPREH